MGPDRLAYGQPSKPRLPGPALFRLGHGPINPCDCLGLVAACTCTLVIAAGTPLQNYLAPVCCWSKTRAPAVRVLPAEQQHNEFNHWWSCSIQPLPGINAACQLGRQSES